MEQLKSWQVDGGSNSSEHCFRRTQISNKTPRDTAVKSVFKEYHYSKRQGNSKAIPRDSVAQS
jgi:hypothetical protein